MTNETRICFTERVDGGRGGREAVVAAVEGLD
jgi:hypothetical protein